MVALLVQIYDIIFGEVLYMKENKLIYSSMYFAVKIIKFTFLLGLIFTLCACNQLSATEEMVLNDNLSDTVIDISTLCGHKSVDGTEYSYDLILKTLYKKEVKWSDFDYQDLNQKQYTKVNLDTAIYEKHEFKNEYTYKIVHVKDTNDIEANLIFCYDENLKKVIACVDESRNLETWFLYERAFCELNCKCK